MASSSVRADITNNVDTVPVKNYGTFTDTGKGYEQDIQLTLEQLFNQLTTDPEGLQRVKIDKTLDLTTLGALYSNVCTIPAGSKIHLAILQITQLVVAGGTTVKVGLGTHGTSPSLLGKTGDLLQNTQIGAVPADAASLIASSTGIDVCGVTSAGSALGDTNISAGMVRVILVYTTPAVLADV